MSAGNFMSADVIAGAVIEISADLTRLRAGVAEAKQLATNLEQQAKVRLKLDTSQVITGYQQLLAATKQRLADEERATVAGYKNLLQATTSRLKAEEDAYVGFYQRKAERQRAALKVEEQHFADHLDRMRRLGESEEAVRQRVADRLSSPPGGGPGGPGPGGGGGGGYGRGLSARDLNPFSSRAIGRALGFAGIGVAVQQGISLYSAFAAADRQATEPGDEMALLATKAKLEAIQSAPVLGWGASIADSITGRTYGLQQRANAIAAAREANRSSYSRGEGLRAELAELEGDHLGALRIGGEMEVKQAEVERLVGTGVRRPVAEEKVFGKATDSDAVLAANIGRSVIQRRQRVASLQYAAGAAASATGDTAIETETVAAASLRAGDSDRALRLNQLSDRQKLEAAKQASLAGATTDQDRERIGSRFAQQGSLLAEQQQAVIEQRKRERTAETARTQAAQSEATLRVQRRNYEADLKAFQDATKTKLSLIVDTKQKAEEAARAAAAESVMVFEQNREKFEIRQSAEARIAAAGARGLGQDSLASQILRNAGLSAEVRNADAAVRGRVGMAAIADLEADRRSFLLPRGYLGAYEPGSELKGGPGGVKGDEQTKLLQIIANGISEIARQLNGGSSVPSTP